MNYILFDNFKRNNLLPLTSLRPVADIRVGILTIREKWEKVLGVKTSTLTEDYLSIKYPIKEQKDNIMINGSVCPTARLIDEIHSLESNQLIVKDDIIVAMRVESADLDNLDEENVEDIHVKESAADFIKINFTWDIFSYNDRAIREDFELLTKRRKSAPVSKTNTVIGEDVFIEKGAVVESSILNAKNGPIYIGKDAEVMEGSMIRGPFALCEHGVLKMGAKIYGATTVGPYSKVGGEVNNSVIFGYSNKAHDGFMGNSVIGEWCNIGADSNTSNLKNTYDNIKVWNYGDQTFIDSGLQFCGLIMGDHSKCGINTMFNTGTVIGINTNVFGGGYQRNFIPSFMWGGTSGFRPFSLSKAIDVASKMYARRDKEFNQIERSILESVFYMTVDKTNTKMFF
jgi:UDP-N-acetylglucosamine diphosphorylase/glucosamine-1-phosphate N-acetyltransferase